jgi:cell division transport system permease protein
MSQAIYLIRKFVLNILGRPVPALASLLSLALLFLMIDLVWIAALSVGKYFERVRGEVDMELFFKDKLPDSSVNLLMQVLRENNSVGDVRYVSEDQARDKLKALVGIDLLDGLDYNPLPQSFIISFKSNYLSSRFVSDFADNMRRLKGIWEVHYPGYLLEKAERSRLLVLRITIFLGIIIFFAVVLNLLYSIRLSVKTREDELEQLRLLGAGRALLSLPYILEGVFYALVASVAGWVLIYYGAAHLDFESFELVFPSGPAVTYFCVFASIMGMFGGYIGVRHSL